jgi:Asp-tRNA(Asn)/Glu-tRNA(Gln) amidotransferase A subunit family amidase
MALRALIVAGALSSIGAIVFKSRSKKKAGGGGGGKARCDGRNNAFVELVKLPAAAAAPPSTTTTKPAPARLLDGLKFAVKDIFNVKGRVAGFGSPAWAATHDPATTTAPAVATLQAAGAAGVGMTHMDELAYSINGENAHYGRGLYKLRVQYNP